MKYFFTCLLSLFVLQFSIQAQATKKSAQRFGLSVIQSFFDHNCDYMFDHFDSSIKSIQGGQTVTITPDTRKKFCEQNPLRTGVPVSYTLYQENYAPKVYTPAELSQKFPEWQTNIQLQAGDYFFDGGHPVAAGNTRMFKTNSMARFAIRMVGGEWKIIAI